MKSGTLLLHVAATLMLWCFTPGNWLFGSEPIVELQQLVPDDVGMTVELVDLRGQLPAINASALAARIRQHKAMVAWTDSQQFKQLIALDERVSKEFGRPTRELVLDLVGQHVLLAIFPHQSPTNTSATASATKAGESANAPTSEVTGKSSNDSAVLPSNEPNADSEPQGVLLTRAANAGVIDEVISAWVAAENVIVDERSHSGLAYSVARSKDETDKTRLCYARMGTVLAITDKEPLLLRILGQYRLVTNGPPAAPSNAAATNEPATKTANRVVAAGPTASIRPLSESANYRDAYSLLGSRSLLSVYINPRRWDADLDVQTGIQSADAGQRATAEIWMCCTGIAAGLSLDEALMVQLAVNYDREQTSRTWQSVVQRLRGIPEFLTSVPSEALLAFAGRIDAASIGRTIPTLVPASTPQALQFASFQRVMRGLFSGLDLFRDVLPEMGANFGVFVVPAAQRDDSRIPVDVVLAWEYASQIPDTPPAGAPTIREGFDNAFVSGLNLWAAAHNSSESNSTPAVVRSMVHRGVTVRWIEGMSHSSPAVAAGSSGLVLASSPAAVQSFLDMPQRLSPQGANDTKEWASRVLPDAQQIFYCNVAQTRNLLRDRESQIVGYLKASRGIDANQTTAAVAKLSQLLQLLDVVAATVKIDSASIQIAIAGRSDREVTTIDDTAKPSSSNGGSRPTKRP